MKYHPNITPEFTPTARTFFNDVVLAAFRVVQAWSIGKLDITWLNDIHKETHIKVPGEYLNNPGNPTASLRWYSCASPSTEITAHTNNTNPHCSIRTTTTLGGSLECGSIGVVATVHPKYSNHDE
jgi:hypothetical protein